MITIARETPTNDFCQDRRTTLDSMLITLEYEGGGTTARNQTITISVERTTGLRRLILTGGECHQTIE